MRRPKHRNPTPRAPAGRRHDPDPTRRSLCRRAVALRFAHVGILERSGGHPLVECRYARVYVWLREPRSGSTMVVVSTFPVIEYVTGPLPIVPTIPSMGVSFMYMSEPSL